MHFISGSHMLGPCVVLSTSGVREKHQDWEALLEKALAEECSAPANLLELVRPKNRAAVLLLLLHIERRMSVACLLRTVCQQPPP